VLNALKITIFNDFGCKFVKKLQELVLLEDSMPIEQFGMSSREPHYGSFGFHGTRLCLLMSIGHWLASIMPYRRPSLTLDGHRCSKLNATPNNDLNKPIGFGLILMWCGFIPWC